MKRREFITLLGGAAVWPLAARAQQTKVPVIGVLILGNPDPGPFLKGLRDGLRDAGYAEGRNIRLEIRSAEGKANLLPERAVELVRINVDIIVVFQTPEAMAAKQATSQIPIVMTRVGDPVVTGLIVSLARPGGNITGLAGGANEVAGKVVELVREMIPQARRIAVLANEADAFTKLYLAGIGAAARNIGMETEPIMVRPAGPLEPAFEIMSGKQVDALITMTNVLRKEVFELAIKHRLPLFSTDRVVPVSGGLASYSADYGALYRQAAVYVDKILKGMKPSDLPVAFPTNFELVINLRTARTLGIDISPTLLARADEVIE
jgi:putative ABC transport system substrate-binding protein